MKEMFLATRALQFHAPRAYMGKSDDRTPPFDPPFGAIDRSLAPRTMLGKRGD